MTSAERKNYRASSKSWLSTVKFVEKRKKSALASTNCDLYQYAGNNPVKYTDPDGRNVTNCTNDYIIARLEDEITLKDGTKIDTVVLAPGDTYIGNVDGTRDKNGDYTKISCQDGDKIDYTVKEGNLIEFDDISSECKNLLNDSKKIVNNTSPLLLFINGYKLPSGSYPKNSKGAHFLSKRWDDRFKRDLDGETDFKKAYESEKQIQIRKEGLVTSSEEKNEKIKICNHTFSFSFYTRNLCNLFYFSNF